ncbi:hypothetical protein ENSA5_08690 [Enhygromyxa salina]|uniref:Uncharacterized protein n=1 Tax=Enhygromyxa salina TaxID=215803 RepID=A0A2S9YGQ9_9BACT|nr:hypothetical protein [Enhygromyxa salina]PRQ04303.1 hypothetical protein ENSA5_08690 [Enhygromyxa salina]
MLDLARHAQVQFSLALLVLLVCLAALAWRNVFGRPPAPDLVIPAWLRSLSVPEVWRRRGRSLLDLGLVLAAIVLALASMSAARLDGTGLDRARVLHEVVQAKYHGELGWDRLYACAWEADHDAGTSLGGIQKVRGLSLDPAPELEPTVEAERQIQIDGDRKRKVVVKRPPVKTERPPSDVGGKLLPAQAAAAQADCRARFDESRWAAFGADLAALGAMAPTYEDGTRESMALVFEGYGSTATPARLARQRLVFSLVPISARSLFVLSLLGGLVAVAALVLVERAYGLRAAGLVGIVCFVEFAVSPVAGGATVAGALVLATVLAGFAAAELERWALAGGLLAFAAVELVWPTLLIAALLAKLGVDWLGRRTARAAPVRTNKLARFALAAAGTAAVLLLLSATLPGGFANWSTWADRVAVHRYGDGSRQIGLRWLFVPDGSWLGGPRAVGYPVKAQRLVDRHSWILLCGVLLLVPSLLAVRRLPPLAFAAIAGVTATFALFSTDASAWGVAVPLLVLAAAAIAKHHRPSELLVGRTTTVLVAGCLALCVGMHGIVRVQPFEPWLFNMVYSHLLTTLLLGLGVALLLLPGLREHGDLPGAPASIPVLLASSGRKPKPKPKPPAEQTTEQTAEQATEQPGGES